jgi:hypothetical protein
VSPDQDFSREQRILNLAVKLQTGDVTGDEMHEAADALSFAAGERLRLEHRVGALESSLAFFMRVMRYFETNSDVDDVLLWRTGAVGTPVRFFLICSGEEDELTPDNLHILEQAFADVADLDDVSSYWALPLFHSRAYGRVINPEMVHHIPAAAVPLFVEAEAA